MKFLVINAGESNRFKGEGRLNKSIVDAWVRGFYSNGCEVMESSVEDFNIIDEQNKFMWADVVVFQFPVYWFSVPGLAKVYIDKVFDTHKFFGSSDQYGQGGLLKGKKFVLGSTWNASSGEFNNSKSFFEGKSVDEVFFAVHKSFEYLGFSHLRSVSFHQVLSDSLDVHEIYDEVAKITKEISCETI